MRDEPVIENLAKFYANSSLYRDTKAALDQLLDVQQKRSITFQEFTYATFFCHQLRWISWCSFKNFLGDFQSYIIQVSWRILFLMLQNSLVGKIWFLLIVLQDHLSPTHACMSRSSPLNLGYKSIKRTRKHNYFLIHKSCIFRIPQNTSYNLCQIIKVEV